MKRVSLLIMILILFYEFQANTSSDCSNKQAGIPCHVIYANSINGEKRTIHLLINEIDVNEERLCSLSHYLFEEFPAPNRLDVYIDTKPGQFHSFADGIEQHLPELAGGVAHRLGDSKILRYRRAGGKYVTVVLKGKDFMRD